MSDPLADLAGEFREFASEVSQHLSETRADLGQHAEWISEVAPLIDDHTHTLHEHSDRLVDVGGVLTELRDDVNTVLQEMPRQPKHPPVCWLELPAAQAAQVWTALGEWVENVLVGRYSVNRAEVPDCWALHPGAVEELTWLRTAWLHAYLPAAGANQAAEWHARWRHDALAGVRAAVVREAVSARREKCGPGTHLGAPLQGTQTRAAPEPSAQPLPAMTSAGISTPGPHGEWTPYPAPGQPAWGAPPPVSVPRGPARDHELGRDPSTDLAERRYWWPHLVTAMTQDVAERRETERFAAEAEISCHV